MHLSYLKERKTFQTHISLHRWNSFSIYLKELMRMLKVLFSCWIIYGLYLPNPSTLGKMWYEFNFQIEYSWFKFRVFFLDLLPNQVYRTHFALLFIYSRRKIRWIHAFPKIISMKWKTNSFGKVLNSGCWFHFLQWLLLYLACLHTYIHVYTTITLLCQLELEYANLHRGVRPSQKHILDMTVSYNW